MSARANLRGKLNFKPYLVYVCLCFEERMCFVCVCVWGEGCSSVMRLCACVCAHDTQTAPWLCVMWSADSGEPLLDGETMWVSSSLLLNSLRTELSQWNLLWVAVWSPGQPVKKLNQLQEVWVIRRRIRYVLLVSTCQAATFWKKEYVLCACELLVEKAFPELRSQKENLSTPPGLSRGITEEVVLLLQHHGEKTWPVPADGRWG